MSPDRDAAIQDLLAPVAQSQAVLIANLALALSQGARILPESIPNHMEHIDLHHRDERVSVLADGMRRAVLETLRARGPEGGTPRH